MIFRIVKMTFKDKHIQDFLTFSKLIYPTIRNWEGCTRLDFLQEVGNPRIFFTYSVWKSENDLVIYRNSDFFTSTWSKTKQWFAAKPEAWSVQKT